MRLKHGAYYFVTPETQKWIWLGRNYPEALIKYYEITQTTVTSNKMGDLFDRYMREIAPAKAPRTYKGNIYEMANLRKVFSDMRVEEIKPYHIYMYLDRRGKQAPVRANREKSLLSHVFAMSIKWGVLDTNPCREVKRIKEVPRDRYITDAEFLAVHTIASPIIKAIMDFAYLTGQRVSDVLKIRLSDMDDEGIHIYVSKVKKKVMIEWSDELRAVISEARAVSREIKGLYLFTTEAGQPYKYFGFQGMWQRLMKRATGRGTTKVYNKETKKYEIQVFEAVIKERFTFNDLRAKAASDAQDLEHARRLLVHATSRTTSRVYVRKMQRVQPVR